MRPDHSRQRKTERKKGRQGIECRRVGVRVRVCWGCKRGYGYDVERERLYKEHSKQGSNGGGVADKPQNQGRECAGKIDRVRKRENKRGACKETPSGAPFSGALSHETARRLTAPRPIVLVRRRLHKMAANYI